MSCFIVSVGGYYGEDIIDIVIVVIVFLHPCEPLLVLLDIMERIVGGYYGEDRRDAEP